MAEHPEETRGSSSPYERYVGRWSRLVAPASLEWLAVPAGQTWGDAGCGTGALLGGVLAVDRSEGLLAAARAAIADQRVQFEVGDATALLRLQRRGR